MSRIDFDIVVIGGGIQGAGVAQAGAAAGYRVLLLEKQAIAAATSSRSSKLIHGGLRYLESGQFTLVRKALRERDILLRIAPDLVRPVDFHIPVYEDSRRRPWQIRLGLSLYALLGGLTPQARFAAIPRAQWPREDGLKQRGLRAIYRYRDAQTDDAALTRAVMASAIELGAELACPAEAVSASCMGNVYQVCYQDGGGEKQVACHALVNASGPWVNRVLERIAPQSPRLDIDRVQGAHLLLEAAAPPVIYYVEAPQDRRAVFVMPWQGRTLIGTTETRFQGDPAMVRPKPEEIAYLLSVYRHYFPGQPAGVMDRFAGVRVLPKGAGGYFSRPRDTLLHMGAPGLLSLYGGKLTGYRATAQQVLARLRPYLPAREPRADTAELPLRPA